MRGLLLGHVQDKAGEDGNADSSAADADHHTVEEFGAQMRAAAEARRRDLGSDAKEASPRPARNCFALQVLSMKVFLCCRAKDAAFMVPRTHSLVALLLYDDLQGRCFYVYETELLAHRVTQKAVDPDAETDADDSDQDEGGALENGLEDRRSKAMSGKATRAKERISKRVRPRLVVLCL